MIRQYNAMTWAGWAIAGLVALLFIFSAGMKLASPSDMAQQFEGHLGYPGGILRVLGAVELTCLILYLVPQTAVLGAILLTGYLGGAVATHVRVEENFAGPIVFGVLVWISLYLRDPRIRALVPWRKSWALNHSTSDTEQHA